jgi:hypothetical protein
MESFPNELEEKQHKWLWPEGVFDGIHAMQKECGAQLGCRSVELDVLFRD